ncbi:hypothetical protein BN946_scf184851.g96 [Trametes cinnabarina]|uniref:Dipeptidylpeptidase IV N-terminal domain-containing protein n=1 Tax=Pycnoporus cinnabarinus TaxID=5643 RepID=A0A060SBE4_PYCCI|nr:hypothetical protein BN946_scf184851.g96 [Trametes cinnabarina]
MPTDYEPLARDAEDFFGGGPSSAAAAYPSTVKPETYYGEGPFDPPSSDDESEELLEKDAERAGHIIEAEGNLIVGSGKRRPASVRYLVIALVSLVSIAVFIGFFAARNYTGTAFRVQGVQHITMDHIFNGTFSARSQSINWVPEAGDGVFAIEQGSSILLIDLKSNSTKELVSFEDVKDGVR